MMNTAVDGSEHLQSSALDDALADLLDLALLANHARWNIIGPRFLTMRRVLEEVADFARSSADRVAERAIMLGHAPDGRAPSIAQRSSLPIIEPGGLRDVVAIAAFDAILDAVVDRVHAAMEAFETDLVTLHLFTCILGMIERYAWMLRAQSNA
jgi:starvation-inducible DNA-binding protein